VKNCDNDNVFHPALGISLSKNLLDQMIFYSSHLIPDVVVFGVGATTQLPSLHSYSLYAMLGVAFTFALQVTFFVACLALDQRRIDGKKSLLYYT